MSMSVCVCLTGFKSKRSLWEKSGISKLNISKSSKKETKIF